MKSFLTYSLGCRTNQAEIEGITNQLVARGFVPWPKDPKRPPAKRDPALQDKYSKYPSFILINTCVVTQKAEQEVRQAIRKFRRTYPKAFLVVLGCGVDAHQKLKINLPKANLLISNEEKPQAAQIVSRSLFTPFTPFAYSNKYSSSGRKLIKIQNGCNQFCAFCIVPQLRGQPKSQKSEEIIKKIQRLEQLKDPSIKEVILTGINLSLYGKDLKPRITLTELLEKILTETKIPRISLSSLAPEVITNEFVNLYLQDWKRGNGRLSRYWHLAIQSGSPEILKRMGRRTTPKSLKTLKRLLYLIEVQIPGFVFRSDFLVGFPGETEKDLQQTLQLIKVLKISFAHVFPFSKRPGTVAYKMVEKGVWKNLLPQVKKERVKRVMKITEEVRDRENKELIGKVLPCLFLDKQNGYWKALADNSWPVRVKTSGSSPKDSVTLNTLKLKSQILPIKINEAKADYLLGSILSFPT